MLLGDSIRMNCQQAVIADLKDKADSAFKGSHRGGLLP